MGESVMRQIIESHIVDSMTKRLQNDPQFPRYACFVVLRRNGEILLAPRNTEPHRGQLSAIGGKVDQTTKKRLEQASSLTRHVARVGFEALWDTALRELREEAFQAMQPQELGAHLIKAQKLGVVYDATFNTYCRLYLVDIDSNMKFSISPRELLGEPVVVSVQSFVCSGINDMTAVLLLHHHLIPGVTLDLQQFKAAAIKHVCVPQDAFDFVSTLKNDTNAHLSMSHELKEPGYIIHIPNNLLSAISPSVIRNS